MTHGLKDFASRKQRLFRAARRSRSQADWSAYKILRNRGTESFRTTKARYITRQHTLLEKEADGTHRWWSLAKDLARLGTKKDSIPVVLGPRTESRRFLNLVAVAVLGRFFE